MPDSPARPGTITVTVVDENGIAVRDAQVAILQTGRPAVRLLTDYSGRCTWQPEEMQPYEIQVDKANFYQATESNLDPQDKDIRVVLTPEQILQQQVSVRATSPGIDPEQISDKFTLSVPEIVNIPYPTNRNLLTLLPFTPGVVADSSLQVHVAGGETYMTLDTLDGFDIRSPVNGTLDVRVSTDSVSSIDTEMTRYPVQYGRAASGIIAFSSGMGDDKFRYNATDFFPSFRDLNGIHFDKIEPRLTFSGPIVRQHAWFFDGVETDFENNYIPGLPAGADTNPQFRGIDLLKVQVNLNARNSLTSGVLFNDLHSPYDGLSTLSPRESTDENDIIAWLPFLRDQQSFKNGVMLDSGLGVMRYREGYEPHGTLPYELTPELPSGSNFDNYTTRAQRTEIYENVFLPPQRWHGSHELRAGLDLDHIDFSENISLAPINYLRENRTLLRRSVFPSFAPFARDNMAVGAYLEDRWAPTPGLLLEPGLRFDWDQIIRRPLLSPRFAFSWAPPGAAPTTKLVAGIGVYYGHTQLEYLTRALAGTRFDTYYAADGTTPTGPPLETTFTANYGSLHEARSVNWSVGVQHKLPWDIYAGANFMQRRTSDIFVYANQNGNGALSGNYLLTNNRQDHYYQAEVDARRTFSGQYTLFASYTRSSATTNSALDYVPTIPILGPQQSGPLPWDTPNRIVSWGWLPAWAPLFPSVRKNWDFVYTLLWNTGFPFDSYNANEQLVGPAGSHRFPDFLSFSPGLEWRFHFRGKYFGLRGVLENATDATDPYVVNPNVDSPQYLTFSQPLGRAFTGRIRLIQSSGR